MVIVLRFLCAYWLAGLALAWPGSGFAQASSAWAEGFRSRARLIAGGAIASAQGTLAGVQIAVDPGFKTYWRFPGESGLPPAFDWSQSTNVADVEVLWPAPARFEDASGVSYGYAGGIVFPVQVTPRRAGEPVRLALKLDYGVCKDICIPAQASLALDLDGSTAEARLIEDALARVPQERPLGAGGDLAILSVQAAAGGDPPTLQVAVAAPAGSRPQLFVEAPDGWYLAARDSLTAPPAGARGAASFTVDILERPKDASGPLDLRLTLVAGDRSIEARARLDSTGLAR